MSTLLAREDAIKKASLALNLIWGQARTLNTINLHDLPVLSEDFFAAFLNSTNGLNLVNLNQKGSNYPGIDLGDKKNGICFQVTAESTATKLKKTITQYELNSYATDYPQLRLLIIGKKSGTGYPNLTVPKGVTFSPARDVIDTADLIRTVNGLTTDRLSDLSKVLDREMPLLSSDALRPVHTDQEALDIMRGFFDRPAFQDDWRGERNYGDFEFVLTCLIGLLNAGHWDKVQLTKPRFKFNSTAWKTALESVYQRVRDLLQLYVRHVRTGEIKSSQNQCDLIDDATHDAFNDGKDAVITEMNALLSQVGMPPLPGVSRWPK